MLLVLMSHQPQVSPSPLAQVALQAQTAQQAEAAMSGLST
jgi:hypothetical protein